MRYLIEQAKRPQENCPAILGRGDLTFQPGDRAVIPPLQESHSDPPR
jgi:hypothetical protein